MNKGAEFSACKKYRFCLWRIWDESLPKIMFIGLNPSTADESNNDPTMNRVEGFARLWGYGGVYMLNCFPYITAYPNEMVAFYNTPFHNVEADLNNWWVNDISIKVQKVVFAWGNCKLAQKSGKELSKMFKEAMCLGKNKNGSPKHPLYLPKTTQLIKFNPLP